MALIVVAVVATLLYLFLSPRFCEVLYRSKIFRPEPFPEGETGMASINGAAGQEVFFKSDNGNSLNAWFYRNPLATKLALCSHGNRGNVAGWKTRTACLLKAGFSVFIYDYQGFGKSEGMPTVRSACQDAVAAFDYASDKLGFGRENIVLYGASLGGGITCELAKLRHCAAIILQSTFTSFHKVSGEFTVLGKVYPAMLNIKPSLNNLEFVKRLSLPLLVLHGKMDNYIRVRHGQTLFDAATSPLKRLAVLPSEEHTDFGGKDRELLIKALTEFRQALG
jgi:alpha-beta hydrolase superfamily lysophospholipase